MCRECKNLLKIKNLRPMRDICRVLLWNYRFLLDYLIRSLNLKESILRPSSKYLIANYPLASSQSLRPWI